MDASKEVVDRLFTALEKNTKNSTLLMERMEQVCGRVDVNTTAITDLTAKVDSYNAALARLDRRLSQKEERAGQWYDRLWDLFVGALREVRGPLMTVVTAAAAYVVWKYLSTGG